jgi:microcystin-dependent protein
MKTKHIIIGLAIILVVLFFVQKKEHAGSTPPATTSIPNLSNEAVQNIAKIYADTNNEAVFNNVKITGDLNVSGKLNILPAGVIVAFNSATAPAGWALCDGTNGTPDLRGRFILGAGPGTNLTNRPLGDKGGLEKVLLNIKEMPHHNHEIEVWGDPNGEPKTAGKTAFKLTDRQHHQFKSWENTGRDRNSSGNRSVTIHSTGGENGVTKSHENMPPFYALMYIMKL